MGKIEDAVDWIGMFLTGIGFLGGLGALGLQIVTWLLDGKWYSITITHIAALYRTSSKCDGRAIGDAYSDCRDEVIRQIVASIPRLEEGAESWIGVARIADSIIEFFTLSNAAFTIPIAAAVAWFGILGIAKLLDSLLGLSEG